jgi:type IV pilus assembly protein PilV
MNARQLSRGVQGQWGDTMIEVLVTMVVVAFGLLSLCGLQMRLQLSDMESYQRAQALVLLDDISSRMAANRDQSSTYVTGANSPLGSGMSCPTASVTLEQTDILQWCNALQGAAEKIGSSKTGAMIGARGCIESVGTNAYLITVAWQGMTPTAAPPSAVGCGAGSYADPSGSGCTGDLCRRAVTTILNIATLN